MVGSAEAVIGVSLDAALVRRATWTALRGVDEAMIPEHAAADLGAHLPNQEGGE